MLDLQPTVLVSRELRPSRVALLVDPDNLASVREAIAWATACWGGVHWPLVPVLGRRPRWWGRARDGTAPDAAAITAGYLETYDPDWIISFVEDYKPPVMTGRVGTVDEWGLRGPGMVRAADPLEAVVEDLFEKRFRFVERRAVDRVINFPTDGPLLGDVVLGRIGTHRTHVALMLQLMRRLGAEHHELTPDLLRRLSFPNLDEAEVVTPLDLGTENFLFRRPGRRCTYVYFCSLRRPWDAIDFWNLRAAGESVVACPLEWADDMSETVDRLLERSDVLAIAARRSTKRERAAAGGRADVHSKRLLLPPVYWDRCPPAEARPARVVADHDVVRLPIANGRFDVAALDPPWAARRWPVVIGGWVNELEIHDDHFGAEQAGVLPHDLVSVEPLLDQALLLSPARVHEGRLVVVFTQRGSTLDVKLPNGYEVVSCWLAERGHRATISDPGRTAREMARKFYGVSMLRAHVGPRMMNLLNAGTRQHHLEWQQVRRVLVEDGASNPDGRLRYLTEQDVLRAGLLVDCPRCRQVNFVLPDDLGRSLRCERCLETFPLPEHRPPTKWAYRPGGPFAVERYAQGAYAALYAIAALAGDHHHSTTWSPSVEVEGLGELDFVLWRGSGPTVGTARSPDLIVGEAKTFDEFAEIDIDRLLRARQLFGQGWLCFATLRESLSAEEHALLHAAAERLALDSEVSPLIVLTAAELGGDSLVGAVNDHSGAEGAPALDLWSASAADLARASQRLYLGRV